MRRFLAGLAMAAFALPLFSCSGASNVKDSVASIADPKSALAASSEAMENEEYYLEFKASSSAGTGTLALGRLGDRSLALSELPSETGGFIQVGDTIFMCFAKGLDVGPVLNAQLPACIDAGSEGLFSKQAGPDSERYSVDEIATNPLETALSGARDANTTVVDVSDRTLAGVESRCFRAMGDDIDVEVCIAKASGLLSYMSGTLGDEQLSAELTGTRDPRKEDFDLPYPVLRLADLYAPFGLQDGDSTGPQQPQDPGIQADWIYGKPVSWATPKCEDKSPFGFDNIEGFFPLDGGSYGVAVSGNLLTFAPDCSRSSAPTGKTQTVIDIGRDGERIIAEGLSGSATIRRVRADGSSQVLAGKPCANCPAAAVVPEAGPALDVVLNAVLALEEASDGALWFVQSAGPSARGDSFGPVILSRVTPAGEVEVFPELTMSPFNRVLVADRNGGVYLKVVGVPHAVSIDAEGTVRADSSKLGACIAVAEDGTAWTYDGAKNGELRAFLPDGKTREFLFLPDANPAFTCSRMAVEPDGDLLFLAPAGFQGGGEPGSLSGVWRIANPLR